MTLEGERKDTLFCGLCEKKRSGKSATGDRDKISTKGVVVVESKSSSFVTQDIIKKDDR